jgi:hypothetical protein
MKQFSIILSIFICSVCGAKEIELFNGKDLAGWSWVGSDPKSKISDAFVVKDGVLHGNGKPGGYIRTDEKYESFILKLQWRTLKAGNGGVLLRASDEEKVWPRSIEAQLNTNDAGDIWNIGEYPMKTDPARQEDRRNKKLHPSNEKPAGEWNDYEIILDAGHLTLKVNGLVQNEATDCEANPGRICIQSEGGVMEYRNITLTPIESKKAGAAEKPIQQLAIDLFGSLTPEQRTKALFPYDSRVRDEEKFPGGPREGVMIMDLSAPQRELAMLMLKRFTSGYGAEKCLAILAQPGNGWEKNFLAFFGEPGPGKSYAWRIAEHHLTIVHVEVENGEPSRFGPILLGADPPVLWNAEEDAMIDLFATLTPAERGRVVRPGKALSAKSIGGDGVAVSALSPTAQRKVKEVIDGRLKFFAPDIQKRVISLIEKQGGLDAMRIAFWGNADKRCADGGKWDFKLGAGDAFLCDYENTRGHIHMSMKGKLADMP